MAQAIKIDSTACFNGTTAIAPEQCKDFTLLVTRSIRPSTHFTRDRLLHGASVVACFVLMGIILISAYGWAANRGAALSAAKFESIDITTVRVLSGDSISSIASTHMVDGAVVSEVADWIMAENDVSNGLIVSGQTLVVPAP